jgi:hypothetical protein
MGGSHKTIIFYVILYGCETWSPKLREEHRLPMFENRVLRRIFRLKRDEVTGGWRKLHNEELHNLYSLSYIIRMIKSRKMKRSGHVTLMWKKRNACRILMGKPEGKRPLGRPICMWVGNVKMDLRGIGLYGIDGIYLAQDSDQWRTFVNMVMNLWVP